jgi:outer membrane protein W
LIAVPSVEAFYFDMKLGGYFPQSNESPMKNADPGLGAEVAVGHFFGNNFAVELSAGSYQPTVPTTVISSQVDTPLQIMPVILSVKLGPRYGDFFPYIIAGGGYIYTTIEPLFESDSDSAAGPVFGIGARYKGFGFEARYIAATVNLLNTDVKLDAFLLTLNLALGNFGN